MFGYKAFVHIPKDEKFELDDKVTPCILVGYGYEKFGYRLWDPMNKKIIKRRDIMFLENQLADDDDDKG